MDVLTSGGLMINTIILALYNWYIYIKQRISKVLLEYYHCPNRTIKETLVQPLTPKATQYLGDIPRLS
ncbi:hypothetical protein EYC84_002423 [Monilinia fructicola]|uniref:Uncharacterized protein n=1 Tax=Monilinia fructicola TaxID=38448 RepID=A0A5M9JPZ2_MONFR|nr:hypothetical protein EYC84_002423 [Monilinia fructicola]